jgi:hypothetical protein
VAQVGVHDQPPVGHSVRRLGECLQGPEAILRAVDHQCLGLNSWQSAADIEAILSFDHGYGVRGILDVDPAGRHP